MKDGIVLFIMGLLSNIGMLGILNLGHRGEANAEPKAPPAGGTPEPKFTQEQLNSFIAQTRKEIQSKYEGYEDLLKFKQEHQQQQTELERKQQEDAGKYEEAKKGYESKIGEFQNILSQKDQALNNLQIGYALQSEIAMQGAYPEAVELLKASAKIQEDGSVKIKGKDANGMEALLDIKTGVEQFLKQKPYLVKASGQGGSGAAGSGQTTGSVGANDLTSLNNQLAAAMSGGNYKLAGEITQKIKQYQYAKGVSSV